MPCAPRYGHALVTLADRLQPRGGNAPSEEALRCLSARVAHAQFETRVLLPKGTIDLGTQRNTLELSNVQKLMKSIALYRMDVNMIVLWHDRKETTNGHDNPLRRAGSESDCGDQRASWRDLRQCGYSACTAHDVQREQAAVHPSQSPNKVGPFIPGLKRPWLSGPFTVKRLANSRTRRINRAITTLLCSCPYRYVICQVAQQK